jgi:hypothetical protein
MSEDQVGIREVATQPDQSSVESPADNPVGKEGVVTRIKNWLSGRSERPRGSEDLAKGDVVGMFDALSTALEQEGVSSNLDVSQQNTNRFAGRLLDSPAFGGLFPDVKAIKLGEKRIIEKANYQDVPDVESKTKTLDEMREVIEKERERLGIKQKVSA